VNGGRDERRGVQSVETIQPFTAAMRASADQRRCTPARQIRTAAL